MTKQELKDFLIEEAERRPDRVNDMDAKELFEAWLEWEGIQGYADDILNVIQAAYGIKID